jgi:hypothetical protein
MLEVLRGVGDREAGPTRESVNGSLALAKLLQQLKSVLVSKRAGYGCETCKDASFRILGVTHFHSFN